MSEWSRKRRAIRHYDQIAGIYDRLYAEEQNAKIDAILPNVCLNEESFVLDVGCGTGVLFSTAVKVQFIIGADASLRLLQKAKKHTNKFLNAHIICVDSDYLPFQNSVFNVVFAITLLQNMPNPLATLEEIKRTSIKGGIIAVTALKKGFTTKKFTKLLNNAKLKILTMKTDDKVKDYIAICQKQ